jgi:hypothetical protein
VKNLLKLTIVTLLGAVILSNMAHADVEKGKNVYSKQLKPKCGITGSTFAGQHSQDEWEEIYDAGKLDEEIRKICHGYSVDESLLPHIYDFAYEYANDSGNVPNC